MASRGACVGDRRCNANNADFTQTLDPNGLMIVSGSSAPAAEQIWAYSSRTETRYGR
jgi:hypothetical protein